jgi:hypothetical protein
VMGVDLYFVKPGVDGQVAFPCWDDDGHPLPGAEFRVVSSLPWAWGIAGLTDAGLSADAPIPPEQLTVDALRALRHVLDEIAAIHPDFRRWVDEVGDDHDALDGLLGAFVREEEWLGADADLRRRAAQHEGGNLSALQHLLYEMRRAGRDGYVGFWSY